MLDPRERWQLALITSTALPLLVAISEIGLRNGTMLPANAAALVGAGVLTVLVFPAVAVVLRRPPSCPMHRFREHGKALLRCRPRRSSSRRRPASCCS